MDFVDNTDTIVPLLGFFPEGETFYYMKVCKMQVDHSELERREVPVGRDFYIRSRDQFKEALTEAKMVAEHHDAHVLLYLNKRSWKNCFTLLQYENAKIFEEASYHKIESSLRSVTLDPKSLWLVEYVLVNIDDPDPPKDLTDRIERSSEKRNYEEHIIEATIPTTTGVQLVCNRFHTERLRLDYPNVEFTTDGFVDLYHPEAWRISE